jgi:SET domain-containing protein
MVHHKNVEIRDLSTKYGMSNMGMVALEPIKKGELIYTCDPTGCTYRRDLPFTRKQMEELFLTYPQCHDYIQMYSYMVDDDLYHVPRLFTVRGVTCECPYFNHSCEPSCHYGVAPDGNAYAMFAYEDIDVDEEITVHYRGQLLVGYCLQVWKTFMRWRAQIRPLA